MIYRSDASEFGIGGYNISSGMAWRYEIPTSLRLRTTLNSLEFISCVITIWIDIVNRQVAPESCILSQSDSSSATGWLRKSNFVDCHEEIVQMTTARHLATLVMKSKCCLYSQWFAGENNSVSDALSRDFHLSDETLTQLILSSVPQQVPFGFQINPLPKEIVSWLTNLLQNQPAGEQWSKQPTRSKLSLGNVMFPTHNLLAFPTHTLQPSQKVNNIESSGHLDKQSERVDFILDKSGLVNLTQLEPPWIMWHRPTAWPTNLTQDLTQMESLLSFYNVN